MPGLAELPPLGAFVAFVFAAALPGAFFPPTAGWYATLQRPPLSPPNWVFGPVWTLLYLMIALSAWLVWREGRLTSPGVLVPFLLQWLFNAAWTVCFFGLQRPSLAMLDITLLWLAIAATITAFRAHSTTAAWLLVPYLLWVSFAAYLNAGFWYLNPK